MLRILKFLLITLIIISCKKEKKYTLTFNKVYEIKGDEILKKETNINSIYLIDTLLLCGLRGNEYHFSVFDTKTLKHLGKVLRKGDGPNELPTTAIYNHYSKLNNELYFWTHDLNSQLLYLVDISKSLKNRTTIVNKKIQLKAIPSFLRCFYINSSTIIGRSLNNTPKMNRLIVYNPIKDSVIKQIMPFPKIKNVTLNIENTIRRYNRLFVGRLRMKPDNKKFVSAMHAFNRIDIFNLKGEVENSILEGFKVEEEIIDEYLTIKDLSKSKLRYYYSDVYASNSKIYALYKGQLDSEYGIKPIPVEIRIFNWKGNPLCKINVPNYLTYFTIDEKNGFMYGIDYYNEKILRYNIKHVLDEL